MRILDDQRGLATQMGPRLAANRVECRLGFRHVISVTRQPDNKGRALPRSLTLGLDPASMQFDDVPGDGEAQAQTAHRCVAAFALLKMVEEASQELRRDALASVTHRDLHVRGI